MNFKALLHQFWGYSDFRPLQREIIEAVLSKKDTIALMPTGGGKSLCYQFPSLILEGCVLVISPLIALMEDQVQQLNARGIKAMYFQSDTKRLTIDQQLDNCIHGNYKVVYTAPERLVNSIFIDRLSQAQISLIAVDEAHCISSWGHDFRPAYRKINSLREVFPNLPVMALTATATPKVIKDIQQNLKMNDSLVFQGSFNRPNIAYRIWKTEDKFATTAQILSQFNRSSIVYCATRKTTQQLASFLCQQGLMADFFHGGLSTEEKKKKLIVWQDEKVLHMVATTAFGMGIDKSNVRTLVHTQIPDSIENYYQETGRAGRDGQPSRAILLYHKSDAKERLQQLLDNALDQEGIKFFYKALYNFFQIAKGEGRGNTYLLPLQHFCERYATPPKKMTYVLQAFENAGLLSQQISQHHDINIRIRCSPVQAKAYVYEGHTSSIVLEYLMRHFPHLFFEPLSITPHSLCKALKISLESLLEALKTLQQLHFISYLNTKDEIAITFLQSRDDDRAVRELVGYTAQNTERKLDKIKAMIAYTDRDDKCLRNQLLHYFGEMVSNDCGKCSAIPCQNLSETEPHFKDKVVALLKKAPHSVHDLKQKLYFEPEALKKILYELLNDQKIQEIANHQYVWNEN